MRRPGASNLSQPGPSPSPLCDTAGVTAAGGGPAAAVDCRWLGIWGAGRITELLLRGLAEDPPERPWVLWGSARRLEPYAWPGAVVVDDSSDPRRWRGQHAWFRVPAAPVVLFAHQRPLRPVPAVTWIFDTISLRYGGTSRERQVRRAYLRRVARSSRIVLTISEHSRRAVQQDLGADPDRVVVAAPPIDWHRAERIRSRRGRPSGTVVFVGRFAPHKNLGRLVAAFERTEFRAGGGRLVLAGGSPAEVASLQANLTAEQRTFVDARRWCDDDDLDDLLVSADLVVQPSLEEGFGLPVAEALAAGVPVCVSDGGALPEVVGPLASPFPATSVPAMAAAIDATARDATTGDLGERQARAALLAGEARRRFATMAGFAGQVSQALEQAAAGAGRPVGDRP